MESPRAIDVLVVESAERDDSLAAAIEDAAERPLSITRMETLSEACDHLADGAEPACVFTAAELSDGTGLELLEWIEANGSDLPVVLSPRRGSETLASEAINEGVADYVPRPATGSELRAAIERVLETASEREIDRGNLAESLDPLRRTVQRLSAADSQSEIADIVLEEATDAIGLEAIALYLFDTDDNVLHLVGSSAEMNRLHEPSSSRSATTDSPVGSAFVEDERRYLEVVDEPDRLADSATELRSCAYVPLGNEGVFVAGSGTDDRLDDGIRGRIDILTAALEAALGRLERERSLRARDRTLSDRTERLERLEWVSELVRGISRDVINASTRAEIERAVCERFVGADRFTFAWIGELDADESHLEARYHEGIDRSYLDTVCGPIDVDTREPTVRTALSRSSTIVENVADGLHEQQWRKRAFSRSFQSVLSVPLSYDGVSYGVLTVYADEPDTVDQELASVGSDLGETIAATIAARNRTSALLAPSRTRIELDVDDESFVFRRLAMRADCTVSFDGGVRQHTDDTVVSVVVSVEGATVSEVATVARGLVSIDSVQVIDEGTEHDDTIGGTVLLELSTPFFALRLADHGVVLHSVSASPEGTRITVDVPEPVDTRIPTRMITNSFESVELKSKRPVERASVSDLRMQLSERITDRQLEVVRTAYTEGFFESPRTQTGEEIAETLDISPAAFYRHNRTVQRKLFSLLFEELDLPAK